MSDVQTGATPAADPLRRILDWSLGLLAAASIVFAVAELQATNEGIQVEALTLGGTPVTVFRPERGPPGPVVVIAHGFAGSQQLMRPFATTFARNGYTAITFDFPGHGRNPAPLTGDITRVDGATRTLVASLAKVAAYGRGLGSGPIAVLGHSMATDVVVRFAEETPNVAATIAVSMFSPAVTAESPRNLLVIVGEWETRLRAEALRAVGLAVAPEPAEAGVTYGDPARGTGRRAAWSSGVEHVGVLYSPASMREAVAWLDGTFGVSRVAPVYLDARGRWIALLLLGVVALGRSIARLLPVVSPVSLGAGLGWRRLWLPVVVPPLLTPLLLRIVPTHFLPVLVADYLAVHFATYGLITMACLVWTKRRAVGKRSRPFAQVAWGRRAIGALVLTVYATTAFGGAMNRYVTSFAPGSARVPLLLAVLVGTLPFFVADEWLTRGAGAARGAYFVTKLAFLVSLLLAVALDVKRLFFLLIIVPIIVVVFSIYGLFSRWAYQRTGDPLVGGVANAIGFAWAIAVTFPMITG